MITVNHAIVNATSFAHEMYPITQWFTQLEEVELSNDEKYWYITLSLQSIDTKGVVTFNPFATKQSKEYKIFKVDANSGNVISMKIRTLG